MSAGSGNTMKLLTPNTVVFDLDNTLYDYYTCHVPAQQALLEFLSESIARPKRELSANLKRARLNVKSRLGPVAASHSRLLYVEQLCHDLSLGFRPEMCLTADRIYWSTFLRRIELRIGAEELLVRLRQQNIDIIVITDLTSEIQLRKIIKLQVADLVDGFYTSEFLGCDKSKLGVESHLLSILGDSRPGCIWFIGDSDSDFPTSTSLNDQSSEMNFVPINIHDTPFRALLQFLNTSQ